MGAPMLTCLNISNLAIMEKVSVELGAGLTVISGETGSGKSMLLRAIGMLLGGKVTREWCRADATELSVEGIWKLSAEMDALRPLLDVDEGESLPDELVVRRSVRFAESGRRDRVFLNDRLASISGADELGQELVNLSSQHESIRLLRKEQHGRLLDSFGGLDELVARCAELCRRIGELRRRTEEIRERQTWRERRRGELEAVVEDLETLDVQQGEENELTAEIQRQTHAVEIGNAVAQAIAVLYDEDGDLASRLGSLERLLSSVSRYESGVEQQVRRLSGVRAEIEDIASELRPIQSRCEADPERLDALQNRLSQLQKRIRRYGVSSADGLLELLAATRKELDDLEDEDASLGSLERSLAEHTADYRSAAEILHARRSSVAQELETSVKATLALVEMPHAVFQVAVDWDPQRITEWGSDSIEFLLSANPGHPPRPLAKIASGGELSRVLLALKVVLSDVYQIPTYVFDEIDSGIGGKTSLSVGLLLHSLARKHQVLVVTHTAQLAAFADHHLCVRKRFGEDTTWSTVHLLDTLAARREELARMLSGMEDSATALKHAQELLEEAGRQTGSPWQTNG